MNALTAIARAEAAERRRREPWRGMPGDVPGSPGEKNGHWDAAITTIRRSAIVVALANGPLPNIAVAAASGCQSASSHALLERMAAEGLVTSERAGNSRPMWRLI